MTKHELDLLLRALRANLKAARAAILGIEPKLRTAFENELNTFYPLRSDHVWQEQFELLENTWKQCQTKVDERCDQLGIPRRFRPSIGSPHWQHAGLNMVKELRADLRRAAYTQISAMVKERIEELERKSANFQLGIMATGIVSPDAKAFFDSLPKVDELFPPLSAKEVFALMEGQPHHEQPLEYRKRELPEYAPDLGVKDEEDMSDWS